MTPSALHVRNYRSFPGPQQVELRPLTLFYGGNSAGKSALVRLLPLLADSVGSDVEGPLNLSSPAARGSTFRDLRWKGLTEDDPTALSLALEWRGDASLSRAEFSMDLERNWQRLILTGFEFQKSGGELLLSGRWRFRVDEQASSALTYEVKSQGGGAELPVRFRGLVPEIPAGQSELVWAMARERLLGLRRAVLWLSSRHLSERIASRPTAPRWTMLPDGSDVGPLLASQPEVREEVSNWCEKYLKRSVEIDEVPPAHFRLALRHVRRAALDIDLLDAGEGVLKVLPVLTAIALSGRSAPDAPRILAIEEPESHLHPTLQKALAEYIATTVSSRRELPCIVMETHSQHILLGMQIAVARGQLQPEQVQVYWVHQDEDGRSVAEPVSLDVDGRLRGNWPPDVYTEVNDMADELLLARQERRRS
ncbi:AAA family ATPase [Archangium lansingense]|uniref:AAA family ATPase n=1 Tax=Archangium lansingense TaxID=2995310 RepID=A0ABT3ZUR5_9BACT|nr:AAA family ATPase [Archangium lansinium]MCY1073158.1 AAA family ATPase [Archangium lansinium]